MDPNTNTEGDLDQSAQPNFIPKQEDNPADIPQVQQTAGSVVSPQNTNTPHQPIFSPPTNSPTQSSMPTSQPMTFNPVTQSQATPQTTQNTAFSHSQSIEPKKPRSKKPVIIGVIATLVLILGSAGFVFGLYLPNQPDNVWKTGLNRTGEAVSKLVNETTSQENIAKLEASKITGSITGEGQDLKISGNIESKFNTSKNNTNLSVQIETDDPSAGDDGVIDLGVDFMSQVAEGSQLPDIFLRLEGFQEFPLVNFFLPGITDYDGQWISISSDYLESALGDYEVEQTQTDSGLNQLTAAEVAELTKAVVEVANERLFNSDESQSLLVQREYIAKEDLGDISAFHYKVSINPDNVAPSCVALIEKVSSTSAYSKFFAGDQEAATMAKDDAIKGCNQTMDEQEKKELQEDTFDLWIDAKYKLIHKIRFSEKDNPNSYIDIGQTYTGGDEFAFFAVFKEENIELSANLKSNFKTLLTNLDLDMMLGGSDPFNMKLDMTIEPYAEDINVTTPEDAVDIEEILGNLDTFSDSFGTEEPFTDDTQFYLESDF